MLELVIGVKKEKEESSEKEKRKKEIRTKNIKIASNV
jgi:hypothetical protein